MAVVYRCYSELRGLGFEVDILPAGAAASPPVLAAYGVVVVPSLVSAGRQRRHV